MMQARYNAAQTLTIGGTIERQRLQTILRPVRTSTSLRKILLKVGQNGPQLNLNVM